MVKTVIDNSKDQKASDNSNSSGWDGRERNEGREILE